MFKVVLLLLAVPLSSFAAQDYLTEDELDLVRDAQEIDRRVPVYMRLAEKRLIVLGLMEKTAKELEQERKNIEKWEKEKAEAEKAKRRPPKEPVTEYIYLEDFTRPELLRGYVQAINEIMSNLDDAYTRRLDIRQSLEKLEEFARTTLPLVEKFEGRNQAERIAAEEAVEKANEALTGAREALEIVPKTERKADQK
jgi:hypothetical protein